VATRFSSRSGGSLILAERPTGIAKKAHLYGNTEAIVVAAMLSHKGQIRLRERVPSNKLSFVIREGQQLRSLGRCEDFAARHRFGV
jgi:hypothetical protein